MINEVPVPKGTEIAISIAAYNRWVLLSHKHIHFGWVTERGTAVIKTSGERMRTSSNPIAGWLARWATGNCLGLAYIRICAPLLYAF